MTEYDLIQEVKRERDMDFRGVSNCNGCGREWPRDEMDKEGYCPGCHLEEE